MAHTDDYIKEHNLDEIDSFLLKEFGIIAGCCSAQKALEYSTARKVAEKLLKQPVSEDLEEAAKESGQRHFPDEYNIWARPNYEAKHAELAFKEGVNWQREQMMKHAVDARVAVPIYGGPDVHLTQLVVPGVQLQFGDKVKLIIVKED